MEFIYVNEELIRLIKICDLFFFIYIIYLFLKNRNLINIIK